MDYFIGLIRLQLNLEKLAPAKLCDETAYAVWLIIACFNAL